ncbi:hypothetical protein [Segeticoccus rhizosphaerae]|uniref:hypothetical protein n=1 Tax=Segeticoccus rhizosphaerae TaxID=1104777 RepID=UPI0012656B23|nr:hypothetical protein [Segeticoccus rhizosphaerae]
MTVHSVSADNKFFERPTTRPASVTDPDTGVVTYPDTVAPDRPGYGTPVKVRLYRAGSDLPDLILSDGGLWTYSWDDDAATSAVIFSSDDGDSWSDPIWSTQSLDVMADLPDALQTTNEIVDDNANAILALQNGSGGGGGAQILVQETGGYPAKVGTGGALWVGKDKPPIGDGYAGGNDLYFQTTSI